MFVRKKHLLMIICCLFLTACAQPKEKNPSASLSNQAIQAKILPIERALYPFVEIEGFLSEDTILVSRQNGDMYELLRRNQISGQEHIIFQTVAPIISCDISPDASKIIIQESGNENASKIQVIDVNGDILWENMFEATEIQWYFNPFRETELYIQLFQPDWSYETRIIDLESQTMRVVEFDQTFFQWKSADEIVYLDWAKDTPATTASLVLRNLKTDATEVVKENCFAFTIEGKVWNIFQVIESENQEKMRIQSILLDENKEIFAYEAPLEESFSENLQVPSFVYSPYVQGLLFYEQANGEPNLFLGTGNQMKKIRQPFQGVLPIHPQMNGKYILVGYQNEWLLQLDTMTWQSMYT